MRVNLSVRRCIRVGGSCGDVHGVIGQVRRRADEGRVVGGVYGGGRGRGLRRGWEHRGVDDRGSSSSGGIGIYGSSSSGCGSRGGSCLGGCVLALGARGRYVLSCVVLLDLEKVLLCMRANLDDVLSLDVLLDLFPVSSMFLQGVQKGLMLVRGPVLAMLGDDIRLAGLLSREGVARERAGRGGGGGVGGGGGG